MAQIDNDVIVTVCQKCFERRFKLGRERLVETTLGFYQPNVWR
jgi:hypothetical protein